MTVSRETRLVWSSGYHRLRFEFNTSTDGSEPYESAVEWVYALAEFIYHNGGNVPAELQFHDSPVHRTYGDVLDEGSYEDQMVAEMFEEGEFDMTDAEVFAVVLSKYLGLLRSLGLPPD